MVNGVDRLKYFVSIENNSYCLWQVELLIESFKRKGLQDDLLIGIAENPNPVVKKYTKNLLKHPHKFVHPNQNEPKPLNKFYALMTALDQKLLPKPFVVIQPDMVIVKPVQDFGTGFLFQPEPAYDPLREGLNYSVPMGNIIGIGTDVDDVLFRNAYVHCKKATSNHQIVAWMQAVYEQVATHNLDVRVALLEQPLLHTALDAHFIHYKHGIPTIFHKRNHKFDNQAFMSSYIDPFDAIYLNNSTKSIDYLCRLIEFYRVGDDS
jgi:hypothetical protein